MQNRDRRIKMLTAAVLAGLDASFAHHALENDREQHLMAIVRELFVARGCEVNGDGEVIAAGSSDLSIKRAAVYFNALLKESYDH